MSSSFWWILLAMGVYGGLHSVLASLAAKARARHWFGAHADRWFRLIFNLVAALTLLPVLALPVILVDQPLYTIPLPWRLAAWAGQFLALVVFFVGVWQTGLFSFLGLRQLLQPGTAPSRLVTTGLYRYLRHPLYTAGLVLIWLNPEMTCNLFALNLGMSAYMILGAKVEERKLLAEFGEAYAAYQRRTPMLIPFVK